MRRIDMQAAEADHDLRPFTLQEIRTFGLTRGSNGTGESRPLQSTLAALREKNLKKDSRRAAKAQSF